MPSNLSSIGFPTATEADFLRLTRLARQFGKKSRFSGGAYRRWSDVSGAEIWLETGHWGSIVGMDPHFAGQARMEFVLTERLERSAGRVTEGAFAGWVGGSADSERAYRLRFDSPDFRLHAALSLPATVHVQIAAFAHELKIYDDDESYATANAGALYNRIEAVGSRRRLRGGSRC